MTLFVLLACLVASSGGLIFGNDIGIFGGVTSMESFLEKFFPSILKMEKEDVSTNQYYCKFNSELLTAFTSSLYLAALIASFFASTVTRVFGRKWSMFGGGITLQVLPLMVQLRMSSCLLMLKSIKHGGGDTWIFPVCLCSKSPRCGKVKVEESRAGVLEIYKREKSRVGGYAPARTLRCSS